jgi:hypothetical protein
MADEIDVIDSAPNEAEVEARQFGWVAQDEFKGDPEDWRPAEEFLKRGREINGYLRKDLEKLQTTLKNKDAEIAEIRTTIEEFRKYHNETEARAYQRAIEDLKKEKVAAIESGDGVRAVEIDEELDTIKEAQRQAKTEKKAAPAPAVDSGWNQWVAKNSWYGKDEVLTALANGMAERLRNENPELVGIDFLDSVTDKVRTAMPEKFENPNRSHSAVSGSGSTRTSAPSNKKSYKDLPSEAKAACDKFVKQGLMTQEQYVAEYEW